MKRALGAVLLAMGAASFALASPVGVPEVDPGSFASALALISGAVLVMRGRRGRG
jgi:hypothetical protein